MSQESSDDEGERTSYKVHSPLWRSDGRHV